MVTLRRIGELLATTSKILPKPLMPEAANVLMGPALMPLARIPRPWLPSDSAK